MDDFEPTAKLHCTCGHKHSMHDPSGCIETVKRQYGQGTCPCRGFVPQMNAYEQDDIAAKALEAYRRLR